MITYVASPSKFLPLVKRTRDTPFDAYITKSLIAYKKKCDIFLEFQRSSRVFLEYLGIKNYAAAQHDFHEYYTAIEPDFSLPSSEFRRSLYKYFDRQDKVDLYIEAQMIADVCREFVGAFVAADNHGDPLRCSELYHRFKEVFLFNLPGSNLLPSAKEFMCHMEKLLPTSQNRAWTGLRINDGM